MRKALYGIAGVAAMATSLFAAPAQAAVKLPMPVPPPSGITIELVTVNGSGCPAGTAAVARSADSQAFTVTYSQYTAMVGVGAKTTDARKNCQINVKVSVPGGYTYAVSSVDYRGYLDLAKGATASESAHYYFQGSTQGGKVTHNFSKSATGGQDWQATDVVPVEALVWSPCGAQRNLNINTELKAALGSSDGKKTTSYISMDSTDGEIETVYHLAFGTCPK